MSILGKTKLWGKGYTTVPSAVRKILELDNGTEIWWVYKDGKVVIEREKKQGEE